MKILQTGSNPDGKPFAYGEGLVPKGWSFMNCQAEAYTEAGAPQWPLLWMGDLQGQNLLPRSPRRRE